MEDTTIFLVVQDAFDGSTSLLEAFSNEPDAAAFAEKMRRLETPGDSITVEPQVVHAYPAVFRPYYTLTSTYDPIADVWYKPYTGWEVGYEVTATERYAFPDPNLPDASVIAPLVKLSDDGQQRLDPHDPEKIRVVWAKLVKVTGEGYDEAAIWANMQQQGRLLHAVVLTPKES